MSAQVIAFPRCGTPALVDVTPMSQGWCMLYRPLLEAALDVLSADDAELDRRLQLVSDEDGRGMVEELVGRMARLGSHIADLADALSLASERIRSATFAR